MSAAYTHKLSVQVLDFEDIRLLIQLARLVCDFCSSNQRFACGFLQIPPRDRHPCRPANDSPCRVRRRLSLLSECALPGAQTKTPGDAPGVLSFVLGPCSIVGRLKAAPESISCARDYLSISSKRRATD